MRHQFRSSFALAIIALGLAALPAAAHVVIADPIAETGSYHAAFFRLSHGCDGSPTRSLTIEIPPEVIMAKPQPKPGWTHRISPAAQISHEEAAHHHKPSEKVAAITWEGHLPDGAFDQFGILLKLPDRQGLLHFHTIQRCASGEIHWKEISSDGTWTGLTFPAPVLRVVAPETSNR